MVTISVKCLALTDEASANKAETLLSSYTGRRAQNNYAKDTIAELIKLERFTHVLEVVQDSEVLGFTGVSERNGWVVITRYARRKTRLPLLFGYLLPYVLENLVCERKGVVLTFNDYNKTIFDTIGPSIDLGHRSLTENSLDARLHTQTLAVHQKIKKLSRPIEHHATLQWVAYIPTADKVPFE